MLALATVVELVLTLGGFFAPERMLEAFKVSYSPETLFLGTVIAWILMALTLVTAQTLRWVLANHPFGWTASLVLGVWWIGIGLDLGLRFGSTANLFMDALKGAIIAGCAWMSRPSKAA
jgi:hypothetical protein